MILQIDEKWSVEYDPDNNDKPLHWLRYGHPHMLFNEYNPVVAMFYALLEARSQAAASAPEATT